MKYAIALALTATLALSGAAWAAPSPNNNHSGNGSCTDTVRPQAQPVAQSQLDNLGRVTVMLVDDCSGLLKLDSSDVADLQSNARIARAVQRAGGQDIVSYDMTGNDITIFARKSG